MSQSSKATEQEFPQRLPRFERAQVPDPRLLFDCLIAIVEPNGARGVWVSNGAAWVTLAAGGSAVWGGIGGTLSSQSDLNSALNGKQATLVSGTNIKTVNGTSLLGSGDVVISGSAAWGGITGTLSSQSDLNTALNGKQATLVSGTNIKTINGTTILGSGDLVVSGGAGDMVLATVQVVTGLKTFGTAGGAVGKFALAGSTSGSTILDASAVASGTMTLPAGTDTLVGKATTDTLTNKTVTALIMGGITTVNGAAIFTSNVITIAANAGTIDVTKPMNTATHNANCTLSLSATPATDTFFGVELINSDATTYHTWTIPSSNSAVAQGLITTMLLGPSGRTTLYFRHLGAGVYDVFGDTTGDRDAAEEAIASASATNIGGTYSKNVSVTGTTGVNGFGTAPAGTYRRGRVTGIQLWTHNGTSFILPGAQNITTAAGDRFDALSLGGGNWVVFNYTRVLGSRLLIGTTISASRALTAADFTDRVPTLFPVDTSGGAVVLTLNTGIIAAGQRAFFQRRGANALTIVAGTGTIADPSTIGAGALADTDIICIVGDPLTANRGVLV